MSEGKRCGTCDDVLVNGNCSVCGGTAYDDVVCLRARCAELEAARDALKLELADATVGDAIAQSESDAENERLRAALEKAERERDELNAAIAVWKAEEESWKATERVLHEERDTARRENAELREALKAMTRAYDPLYGTPCVPAYDEARELLVRLASGKGGG